MERFGTFVFRLRHILRYGDPRPAMLWFAWGAGLFGALVLVADLVRLFHVPTPVERVTMAAFRFLPGWLVGTSFLAASAVLAWGVVAERRLVIQRAALVLLAVWIYTWLTIPFAAALGSGNFFATAFARYFSPIPVAWWIYARASYQGGFLGPGVVARERTGAKIAAAAVVVPSVALASLDVVLAQAFSADVLPEAAWVIIGGVVTALLTYLGQRYAKRTDAATAFSAETFEHNRFLFGAYGHVLEERTAELRAAREELAHARGQLTGILRLQEAQDHFCRNNCPTFVQRPTTIGLPS